MDRLDRVLLEAEEPGGLAVSLADMSDASPASANAVPPPAGRRVLINSAALTIGQIVARAISVLSTVVIAHALGPARIGEIAVAAALAVFFAGIGDAGLTFWSYREIVLAPKLLSRIVVDTTFVQLWLSLALAAVLGSIAIVAHMPAGQARLLLLFTPFLLAQALSVQYALEALEQMVTVAAIGILIQVVTTAGTIAFVLATRDPIWVPIALWVGQFIGDAVIWWRLRARHGFELTWPRPSSTKRLLENGLPLLVTILLLNYWGMISTVFLAFLRSSRQLGIYSVSFSLVFTAWTLAYVAAGGTVPELVRRARDDRPGFATLLDTLVRLTTRLTLTIAAFVIAAAEPLVRLLYGGKFAASAPILQILAPIIPLGWFTSFLGYALLADNQKRAYAQGLMAGAAFATVAYPVGAALFGATGTAVVSTVTVSVFAMAYIWYARRHLGVNPAPAALREWRYGVVPLVALLAFDEIAPFDTILVPLAAWAVVVAAVELANGLPTARQLIGLRRLQATSPR
ncbi:MAG: oligosaccharide flippase family protein [Solirubrobacteraceae bacterium]